MGHYSLDVDPDAIQQAGNGLVTLGEHLTTRATEISGTPGEVPQTVWSGGARDSIMTEVTALGSQVTSFGGKFGTAGEALRTLAEKARTAEDVTLAGLNSRWQGADDTYNDAVGKANTNHTQRVANVDPEVTGTARTATLSGLSEQRQGEIDSASRSREATRRGLNDEYDTMILDLRTAFRTASGALEAATIVAVPDETVAEFVRSGMTGMSPGRTGFPPEFGADDMLGAHGVVLARDKHDMAEGQQAAAAFDALAGEGPRSKEEIDAFLATLKNNPAFRAGFLNNLSLDSLDFWQRVAHGGVDAAGALEYGKVVTAISGMLAVGSNPELQGDDYPIRPSLYQAMRDRAADPDRIPPEEGYLFLAEIVQAGQGGGKLWDSALLAGITRDTIAFEKKMKAENPTFFWGELWGNGYPVTEAFRNQMGIADVTGRADAVAMLMDAMEHDPDASIDLISKGTGAGRVADTDMLHYLYDGRRDVVGWGFSYGDALGGVMNAATSFTGTGGPGTDEYVAAQAVTDFVKFFGSDPSKLWPLMEQDVVDMMTHHIQAVNMAIGDFPPSGTDPQVGDPDALLARDRLTNAVLDPAALDKLMQQVFRLDYFADDGRPLYQQFSAVQTAAIKQDFLVAAAHPDQIPPGRLQSIAGEHGAATASTSEWLKQALMAEGMEEQEAAKQAREAADWVLGLATDQIPMDKLPGIGGDIAGLGVDALKGWALDATFPESTAGADAEKTGTELADDARKQNALVQLTWLDEADLIPPEASPSTWAEAHPDQTSFMRQDADGRWLLADPVTIYQQRNENPEAWNDFRDYWQQQADPLLRETDLYENFALGTLGR